MLRKVHIFIRLILQSFLLAGFLGLIIWKMFSFAFDKELKHILESALKDQLRQIEILLLNYENSLKEYARFRQDIIKKILLTSAEDFYLMIKDTYNQVQNKKIQEKEAKQRIQKILLEKKIGKTGYIYILDSQGNVVWHPKKDLIGTNQNKNESRYDFIREQMKNAQVDGQTAFIEYNWKNPDEEKWRPKVLAQIYFKEWDWIISVSSYKVEFDSVIDPYYQKNFFTELKMRMRQFQIGKQGYPLLVVAEDHLIQDIEGNILEKKLKGQIMAHPDSQVEGKLIQEVQAEVGEAIFKNTSGIIEYFYKNEKKIAAFKYYPSLKWIILVTAYPHEYLVETKENIVDTTIQVIIILLLVNLALIILFFYLHIYGSIKKIQDKVHLVSQGDLSFIEQKISDEPNDIIGKALFSLKNMTIELKKIIKNIIESSQEIQNSIQELSQGNEELSQRTEKQAVALEELSSTLEEFTSIVNSNTENAEKAARFAQEAKLSAENGGEIVYSAVEAMKEIEKSSSQIEEIIGSIEEIAFQTNLLALNAAVEAARAGEHGKGFAVVAMEIRNLAKNTSLFAKKVYELIRKTVDNVREGSDLVYKSGEALQSIIDVVTETTNAIAEVSAGSSEQKTGVEEINKAILQLQEINDQNSQLAEEIFASSREMVNKIHLLRQKMEFFKIDKTIKKEEKVEKKQENSEIKPKYTQIIETKELIEPDPKDMQEF